MNCLDAHYANNGAEHVSLFEVDVDQIRRTSFNMLYRFANVADFEFRRQRDGSVKALSIESHYTSKFSRFIEHCKSWLSDIV